MLIGSISSRELRYRDDVVQPAAVAVHRISHELSVEHSEMILADWLSVAVVNVLHLLQPNTHTRNKHITPLPSTRHRCATTQQQIDVQSKTCTQTRNQTENPSSPTDMHTHAGSTLHDLLTLESMQYAEPIPQCRRRQSRQS